MILYVRTSAACPTQSYTSDTELNLPLKIPWRSWYNPVPSARGFCVYRYAQTPPLSQVPLERTYFHDARLPPFTPPFTPLTPASPRDTIPPSVEFGLVSK